MPDTKSLDERIAYHKARFDAALDRCDWEESGKAARTLYRLRKERTKCVS